MQKSALSFKKSRLLKPKIKREPHREESPFVTDEIEAMTSASYGDEGAFAKGEEEEHDDEASEDDDQGQDEDSDALHADDRAPGEPSKEDLLSLEQEMGEEVTVKSILQDKQIPAVMRDLLANYMEELSHIPLFKPDQEKDAAEQLVKAETFLWETLLKQPLSYDTLLPTLKTTEPAMYEGALEVSKIVLSAAKKSKALSGKQESLITQTAAKLREVDCDKEAMEEVVRHLRKHAWSETSQEEVTIDEETMLLIERARGDSLRGRNDFVRANLRLVVSVARSFHNARLPFIDLIQEGNVGLMKAVHRYDHTRGFRFSTYAIWWIRQAIERAIINKGSAVRLPVHVIDARRQLSRMSAKLLQKLGRAPSENELAKAMHMPAVKVNQILSGVHQDPVSLDDIISGDDPRKYLDLVRDESRPAVDESLIRENTRQRLRELLTLLSPIEKDIIKRRFGMYDGEDQTLDEIGKFYNLSRERVRQIQTQGLAKMRRMCDRRNISNIQ